MTKWRDEKTSDSSTRDSSDSFSRMCLSSPVSRDRKGIRLVDVIAHDTPLLSKAYEPASFPDTQDANKVQPPLGFWLNFFNAAMKASADANLGSGFLDNALPTMSDSEGSTSTRSLSGR